MSWWSQVAGNSEFLEQFRMYYDLGWQIFPRLFGAPDPAGAVLNVVLWPVGAVLSWLIYGTLAHWFARLLGGMGTLNQTLGATALAAAPQMLNLLMVLPFVVIFSLGTWTLLCNYMALRTVHGLSWGRSVAAALLPSLVFVLVFALAGCGDRREKARRELAALGKDYSADVFTKSAFDGDIVAVKLFAEGRVVMHDSVAAVH